jgi:DNA-directed RNA polymerase specialized sigma24 family protein
MKKELVLTQDSFDALLNWLDADRDRAAKKYELIRLRLIKMFFCRGCLEAEYLSDETINRVASKVSEISKSYVGDPARYFYAVAQNVHREYLRTVRQMPRLEDTEERNQSLMVALADAESDYQCAARCLENLPTESRDLVVRYYVEERQSSIEHTQRLAVELGIGLNALRIRAHRIRLTLRRCIQECLKERV